MNLVGGQGQARSHFAVVFGKDDDFINRFSSVLKWFIGYFPLACPDSKLSPVYVGDLVERIVNSIDDRESHSRRFQVCGPEVFTLRQILELIIHYFEIVKVR